MAIEIENPVAGLDRLLHQTGDVRGWGAPALPDPVLFAVTGFDTTRNRYSYRVNPHFGRPLGTFAASPSRLTIDFTVDLGQSVPVQQVQRFLGAGRTRAGARLDSAALVQRYARGVPDLFRLVLRDADSLFLTRTEVDSLQALDGAYRERMGETWGHLAAEFSRLGEDFDAADALGRQQRYLEQAWDLNREAAKEIQRVLSALQFSLTNGLVQSLANGSAPRVPLYLGAS